MAAPKAEVVKGEKVRIMIVDDHPVFRLWLCELINQEKGPRGLRRGGRLLHGLE